MNQLLKSSIPTLEAPWSEIRLARQIDMGNTFWLSVIVRVKETAICILIMQITYHISISKSILVYILNYIHIKQNEHNVSWNYSKFKLIQRINKHHHFCRNNEEDAAHLFFNCSKTLPIWWESLSWVNISGAFPQNLRHHFLQHAHGGIRWTKGS